MLEVWGASQVLVNSQIGKAHVQFCKRYLEVSNKAANVVRRAELDRFPVINNYWMRLSMISWIIKTEVCVIMITHDIMRKLNLTIVLLYIFHIIHPQIQKWSIQPFCFWGEHSKGLSNQAEVELDMINAISAADIAFIMSSSQAIIVNWLNALDQSDFIASLMYNNKHYLKCLIYVLVYLLKTKTK